ncbi:replication initiation protein RepM [Acinetobacter nectaris]|uniref:replication initiation protein RepM n=1 Tax=Acinetobacter nectaris TaxID=1219382 RepID=UPI001F007FB7|nr:replication initiation protein RepM [Acinetobacter nectaris]MCF9000247.1 replication initiation protein [Acinetobacter nectaris]MCF9028544.1 replication initiation protein [Acinetobacter nectaris]
MATDLIVKNNALIDASYTLSLVEQRLIGLALVKANNQQQEVTSNTILTIHASEYAQHFNTSQDMAYRSLKEASERLFLRYFSYTLYGLDFGQDSSFKPPKKLKSSDVATVMKSRWVQKAGYTEALGLLHFQFTDDVVSLISNSKEYFTSYYLSQTVEFTSTYATRLFELLMKWESVGHIPFIEMEKLRGQLGVDKKQYKMTADFKKRVLDIAVEQVNQFSDYTIGYEQHKQGRTITGFSFKFKQKNPKKVPTGSLKDKNTIDLFTGLTEKQISFFAHKLAHDHDFSSKNAEPGEDYADLERRLVLKLADPDFVQKNMKKLEKIGFKSKW